MRSNVARHNLRIVHRPSGLLLAEGPLGWGITRFEGNYYIRHRYMRARALKPNWIPGLYPYKGLYVWLDLRLSDALRVRNIGWFYWLPNPLLPFVAFRVALPGDHPDLVVEDREVATESERRRAA